MAHLILALHGFRSSSASWKIRRLKATLAERGQETACLTPDLSHAPGAAIAQCEALIAAARARGDRLTLMGSSLGGYYATWLAERHALSAVLINPAVVARLDPRAWLGRHAWLHRPEASFEFTEAHLAELAALAVATPTPERYWLLLATGDAVLDYRDAVRFYAKSKQTIVPGGDHGFPEFPAFIPQILDFAGL